MTQSIHATMLLSLHQATIDALVLLGPASSISEPDATAQFDRIAASFQFS
jgi:hypothetical protein